MKKIISLLMILSLSVMLFGCGNTATEETTTVTTAETAEATEAAETAEATETAEDAGDTAGTIAAALASGLQFNDEIEENENATKNYETYSLDETTVTDIARYVGSGATAEEIAVFQCADAAAVETVKSAVEERIQYLHDGYSDYGPDQVPEIDSAVVLDYGNIVVFCICLNPDAVQGIVEANI